jgi:hypothetical protein
MDKPVNRMAKPETRTPEPIERVLVQPPPESVIKCPRCGAARINGWLTHGVGTVQHTGEQKRICRACGTKVAISTDWQKIRVIG